MTVLVLELMFAFGVLGGLALYVQYNYRQRKVREQTNTLYKAVEFVNTVPATQAKPVTASIPRPMPNISVASPTVLLLSAIRREHGGKDPGPDSQGAVNAPCKCVDGEAWPLHFYEVDECCKLKTECSRCGAGMNLSLEKPEVAA